MVKDAEKFAEEDRKFKERQDARNELDSLVLGLERMLRESGDKVPEADKTAVEAAVAKAKTVLENQSATAEEFTKAKDELQQSSYTMAEKMYQAQQAAEAETGGATPPHGGDDDVIEAEFADDK